LTLKKDEEWPPKEEWEVNGFKIVMIAMWLLLIDSF
jgi:hypothetical protein